MHRKFLRRTLTALSLATIALITPATPGQAAGTGNWAGYLFNAGHGSYNAAATSITPANVSTLTQYWHWKPPGATQSGQPGGTVHASPTFYDGRVYLGADTGNFYALDLASKTVVWSAFLGYVPHFRCTARGITSTATVATDPSRGGQLTVYVAGGDGYLYALRASDGATVWRSVVAIPATTQNDYYNWASPAVRNGKIYMGVSSNCDKPLVRGGVKAYRQSSGALLGTYFTVPQGQIGGSVWSSVAVNASGAGGAAFVTTGNGQTGDVEAVVRLNGSTMAREDAWAVPPDPNHPDSDFGASPTLFSATINGASVPMVGACNKNGIFYALQQQNLSAGPVWQLQVADASAFQNCLAAAIWNGRRLYVATPDTTIGGTHFPGSVRQLDPATGAVGWALGLPSGGVIGSPTLNGSGVLAAGTHTSGVTNAVYLISSANGQLLRTISVGSTLVYAQPVFAANYLLVATTGKGLFVYRV
jgi:polyvinyl alcohol dehydrogenase (cytochrome)